MDQLLMSLRALVFLCAWYGTFGSALYLVLRARDVRASLRRAREPRLIDLLDMHCEHAVTWWCGTHGWYRCVACGYCWGNCERCTVYVKGPESEARS